MSNELYQKIYYQMVGYHPSDMNTIDRIANEEGCDSEELKSAFFTRLNKELV